MKKNILIVAALLGLAAAGCESSRSNDDRAKFYFTPNSEGVADAAGTHSQSSDPNPASSSQSVGQSGTTTNRNDLAPAPAPQ
ncbi:MAG: hypothetical protein ABIQ35_13810 [Verrucomicrobiota bacterium]